MCVCVRVRVREGTAGTHRSDLLAGVGELASQPKVQHVAGPAGAREPAHGEVRLERETRGDACSVSNGFTSSV